MVKVKVYYTSRMSSVDTHYDVVDINSLDDIYIQADPDVLYINGASKTQLIIPWELVNSVEIDYSEADLEE